MKKNIASIIIIAALIAGYFVLSNHKGKQKKGNEKPMTDQSIAVLPFVNMNNDSSKEYFSDGLTEGIINSLAHLKGLKVCARTSSFKFKKKNIDLKEIGNQLGVGSILEGSVQLEKGQIIITANLIN